jgi:hypothetical protein
MEASAERDNTMKKTQASAAIVGLAFWTTTACSSRPATPGVATLTAAASTGASSAPAGAAPTPDAAKYALCIRAHGVPDFPDPVDGGFDITSGPRSDLDPNSPQFVAADTACKALSPEAQAANGTADPKTQAAALKFSACMRSHGVHSYPDPVFIGGSIRETVKGGSGLDANSPQFIAAQKACGGSPTGSSSP